MIYGNTLPEGLLAEASLKENLESEGTSKEVTEDKTIRFDPVGVTLDAELSEDDTLRSLITSRFFAINWAAPALTGLAFGELFANFYESFTKTEIRSPFLPFVGLGEPASYEEFASLASKLHQTGLSKHSEASNILDDILSTAAQLEPGEASDADFDENLDRFINKHGNSAILAVNKAIVSSQTPGFLRSKLIRLLGSAVDRLTLATRRIFLRDYLSRQEAFIRRAATFAIIDLNDSSILPSLREALEIEQDPHVRKLLQQGIEYLSKKS